MFNKTFIYEKRSTEVLPYEKTVNINRAPTDESIRLLKEFEEKAVENIIDKIHVNDNNINGLVLIKQIQLNPFNHKFYWKFTLNGKEYRGDVELQLSSWEMRNLVNLLAQEISKIITAELINSFNFGKDV